MNAADQSATGRRGMVTSPHRLASEAGIAILRQGGNAIEAAIAIASTLAVTYPHFCGLGGDAVWLVADRQGRQQSFLGIGQAAQNCEAVAELPVRGPDSALTSACAVDSWRHAFEFSADHWGGRLSFSALLDAAIGHAENGFPVTSSQSFWLDFRPREIDRWPGFADIFLPDGEPPAPGDNFVQPQLAASLKALARNGAREFYEGELARRIATGLAGRRIAARRRRPPAHSHGRPWRRSASTTARPACWRRRHRRRGFRRC